MDPATRRLALIAGGLGGALLAVIAAWTVMGQRSTAVPVILADSRPVRVKPANPGGMQIPGANDDALSGGTEAGGDRLAPPPEVPAPLALGAFQPQPAPAPPVPTPASVAAAPAAAKAPPAAKAEKAVAEKPVAEKPGATAERRAAPPAAERAAPAAKPAFVQFAAVTSEEAARSEWQRLEKRMPDLIGHRQPAISKIEHNGRTFWRLRTGGFGDVAQATAFCERVRAKGGGCSIADF
jgi:hypothetical protein